MTRTAAGSGRYLGSGAEGGAQCGLIYSRRLAAGAAGHKEMGHCFGGEIIVHESRRVRRGRDETGNRRGLKTLGPEGLAGSNPAAPTNLVSGGAARIESEGWRRRADSNR